MFFAYPPDEAEQAFRQAARLGPGLAMAWWGVGLRGPRDGMRALVKKYPSDADARALFAEAIMDLHPLAPMAFGGRCRGGDRRAGADPRARLGSDPDHMGLLHFYIHAVEASRQAKTSESRLATADGKCAASLR
jgi:hypothetical protein